MAVTIESMAVTDPLMRCLQQRSACFANMVELIPAKYYIVRDEEAQQDGKYWQNKKLKAPRQAVKEATKRAKRLKLDPESHRSVQELKQEADRKEEGEGEELNEEDDDQSEGEMDFGGQLDTHHDSQAEPGRKGHTSDGRVGISVEKIKSGDLNELRDRLKQRIAELRGKRKADDPDKPVESSHKRQKLMERRNLKQKKRKKLKERKSKAAQGRERESGTTLVKDENGQVVFNKFDFSAPTQDWESEPTKKDYQKLLAKAEAKKKRLETIKRKDEEAGLQLSTDLNWEKALEMAGGTKPRDDPQLLKKTIKRLGKKKDQSRKTWQERARHEQQTKDKRQEVRKKHVQERIQQIKAKKMKKAVKKRGKFK